MLYEDYLLVFLLVCILILYLISMMRRFTVDDIPDEVRYIDVSEMNTGDIVCVSYNNTAGHFVESFTGSCWIHTGIVWVDPRTNIRYIMEGAIYGKSNYKHFFIIPVPTWMNYNRNNLVGFKKYSGPKLDEMKMALEFSQFAKNSKLRGLDATWLAYLFTFPYKDENVKHYHTCFETTILMCQKMGIYKKDKHYSSHFPCDIVNDNVSYEKNISYSKVVQIKLNSFTTKLLLCDMQKNPNFWKNEKTRIFPS